MSVLSSNAYRYSVLVMGITGAGKSRLVNMIVGDSVGKEGNSSRPCTQRCSVVPIKLNGTEYFLIDTPSFDPTRDGIEILCDIGDVLVSQHKMGIGLRGVIYVHPVTHENTAPEVTETLKIINMILGTDKYRLILPVYSQWARVAKREGALREEMLAAQLDKQAAAPYKNLRFNGDRQSAAEIANTMPSLPPIWSQSSLISEIADYNLHASETTAGRYIRSLSVRPFTPWAKDSVSTPKRAAGSSIWGLVPTAQSANVPQASRFASNKDEEMQAAAEFFVHHFLQRALRDDYNPVDHWTSNARRAYGHKPFGVIDLTLSSFTIKDKNGRLREYLEEQGMKKLTHLVRDAIFHIQVVWSSGEINSAFELEPEQVQKAKNLHASPMGIMILAYVANIDNEPSLALFSDLWQQHLDGSLSLHRKVQGCFSENTAVLYINTRQNGLHQPHPDVVDIVPYRALKHGDIRLLELKPAKFGDPLVGEIVHVSITNAGEYQAISYVWGAPSPDQQLYLVTSDGKFRITPSLDMALRVIRNKKGSLRLWADAICINQLDLHEKGMQIRRMSEIFSKAVRVVAWLGDEASRDRAALKYMERLCSRPSSAHVRPARISQSVRSLLSREKNTNDDFVELDNVHEILKRPWFERAWIAQELVLSSTVTMMCGQQLEMQWDQFFQALLVLGDEYNMRGERLDETLRLAGPAYALGMTRRNMRENKKYPLFELLELFSHTKATIEVDKLFALLGLAHDGQTQAFSPDYDSSLEDVVRAYAKGFIDQGRILDLLSRSGQGKSYGFSSWIPNLTSNNFPKTISRWESTEGFFAAGGMGFPEYKIEGNRPSTLEIKGKIVTAIQETRPISMKGATEPNFFHAMTQLRDLLNKTYPAATPAVVERFLAQVPIGKARRPHLGAVNRQPIHQDSVNYQSPLWPLNYQQLVISSASRVTSPEATMSEQKVSVDLYWQTMKSFASHIGGLRGIVAFCVTGNRTIGLVPQGAAVGDQVCVIPGAKVPFILRKNSDSETWRMIGECYVDGLMYGEGMRGGGQTTFVLE